jgi:hypothetical protein
VSCRCQTRFRPPQRVSRLKRVTGLQQQLAQLNPTKRRVDRAGLGPIRGCPRRRHLRPDVARRCVINRRRLPSGIFRFRDHATALIVVGRLAEHSCGVRASLQYRVVDKST